MNINSLASTLHEIRTPIQTVLGTAELLKETSLDSEQQEYVRQIAFSADVIYTLVSDILDYKKIKNGKQKLENIPFNIQNIAEQSLDLVSIEAYNKGLELATEISVDTPEMIYGDPVRMLQILLNMVKNAVKFTNKGHVVIKISPDYQHSGFLLFKVSDTGIGIPKKKKKQIFKRYVQASSNTVRKYGGSGLGLSICVKLIKFMGGKIGVTNSPEGGAEFWFRIPLQVVKNSHSAKRIDLPKEHRVLIVDDSPFIQQNMLLKLQRLNINNGEVASSGNEALKKMNQAWTEGREFSIVFIDMTMSVMDGWRLASEISSNKQINGAKLYLMIPEGQLGGEAKMKMLSWFNGYLYKPIKQNKLYSLLKDAIETPFDLPAAEESSETLTTEIAVPAEQINTTETEKISVTTELKPCTGCFVLAVDDHPVNLKIMSTFLSGFGCKVITASCGTEAIQVVQSNPEIDIVFMDIQMPDINGTKAAKKIREFGYKGIIIACSANSDTELKEEYRRNNMNDMLIKPFKKQQLLELIEKWWRKKN